MTALELSAVVLDRLGAGDDVFAAEAIKEKAATVAAALARDGTTVSAEGTVEERLTAQLAPVDDPAEELLAVLLPVVEYGGARALDTVPRAFLHIARHTSLGRVERGFPLVAGVLVVGRLAFGVATYALHCGRLDGLTAAWRARSPGRFEDDTPEPLLAASSLRHPDVFERSAHMAYEDYRSWLAVRELITTRYPLFLEELNEAFAEADLLLALKTAAVGRKDVYSHGCRRASVVRFRTRLTDPLERETLARLFAVPMPELDQTLTDAYVQLRTDHHGWDSPPPRLLQEAAEL